MLYGNGQSVRFHETVGANLLLTEKRLELERVRLEREREFRALRSLRTRLHTLSMRRNGLHTTR